MSERTDQGMPGFMKALKLVLFINELDFTDEEITEALDHFRKADSSHGLLWGDIANFHRENQGLGLLRFLSVILKEVKAWGDSDEYPLAVVAANLQRTQEIPA